MKLSVLPLLFLTTSSATATSAKPRKLRTRALSHIPIESRIVGGIRAEEGAYPFFVQWNGCGASLIHEDIILSAAHCNPITNRRVLVGAYKSGSEKEGDAELRQIVERRQHPSYNAQSVSNDYLVMKLDRPSTKTPVAINSDSNHPQNLDNLTVMGFGTRTEGGSSIPTFLREVDVKYVDNDTCNAKYDGDIEEDVMFCAGDQNGGKDSCQGDSGGPIIDENGVQVGIVSWGIGCGRKNYPGVYSRISGAIDWINQQICELSDNPPAFCEDSDASPPTEDDPPPQQGNRKVPVRISLTLDDYPQEIGFEIEQVGSGTIITGHSPGSFTSSGLFQETIALEPDQYLVRITDTYGDGLCCNYGSGGLSIDALLPGGTVVLASSDGLFTDGIEIEFEVPALPQDEEGDEDHTSDNPDENNPPDENPDEGNPPNGMDPPADDTPSCEDFEALFHVDASVGEADCDWLGQNIGRYGYLCQFLDVASTCQRTCDVCEYFQ